MTDTIVRIFDHFSDAQDARQELIDSGIPASSVRLQSGADEAGPVAGNFTIGNSDTKPGVMERLVDSLTGGDSHQYEENYKRQAYRGVYQLYVDIDGQQQGAHASAIMQRRGGTDIEEITPNSGP